MRKTGQFAYYANKKCIILPKHLHFLCFCIVFLLYIMFVYH